MVNPGPVPIEVGRRVYTPSAFARRLSTAFDWSCDPR